MMCGASALPPVGVAYFKGATHGGGALYSENGAHLCTRERGHEGPHTKKEYGMVLGEYHDESGRLVRQVLVSLLHWRDEHELIATVTVETLLYKPERGMGPTTIRLPISNSSGTGP